MNPSNTESSDDVREIPLDLPLFMMDRVIEEVADGRAELTGTQRKNAEKLKAGGRSGITLEFGKMVIDGSAEGSATAHGIDLDRTAAEGKHVEVVSGAKPAETMPPDVAELLVRVLSSPEFESLLDQPAPTMLWTPETAGSVSDKLAGRCLSFRLAEPAVVPAPAEIPAVGVSEPKPEKVDSGGKVSPGSPSSPAPAEAPTQQQPADGQDRPQHAFMRELGLDQTAWTKRLELRLLLQQPGQSDSGVGREAGENKPDWLARPRFRRTLERPAILGDITQKDAEEKPSWAKRPKLRGTLERPAVLEDLIQKEAAGDHAWAKRPRLRQTLERPANIDDILRDARQMFIANLTAASKYYGRHDEAGGDSAVDKAIFELVRPGGVTESGVAVAPIILATLDGILFEYGRATGDTTVGGEGADGHASADAESEKRQVSMHLAQMAQMNILAANAANSSAKLVAEAGRALVKVEEMSSLTSSINDMVKDAISNRASSIQHSTIESMARAAAKENCTEPLVTLIKKNVREAIEIESKQTLKQTIKTMSVKSVEDQRAVGPRPARGQMPTTDKRFHDRDKDKKDEPVAAGSGGAAAERTESTRARESVGQGLESFEKYKAAGRPQSEIPAIAATAAETKPRPQKKKLESTETEPPAKKHGSLEVGGPATGSEHLVLVPQNVPGAITIRMIGRSGQEMSRLGELLVAALSRRPLLARLIAACNVLRSEGRPPSDSTVFDISLDGLGSGETLLIVFAKDREEALRLQAQMTEQLSVETEEQKKEDEALHLCEGSATMPIASLVTSRPIAAAESGSSVADKEQPAPPNMDKQRDAVQSQSPKSAWDACKQVLGRLFGSGPS